MAQSLARAGAAQVETLLLQLSGPQEAAAGSVALGGWSSLLASGVLVQRSKGARQTGGGGAPPEGELGPLGTGRAGAAARRSPLHVVGSLKVETVDLESQSDCSTAAPDLRPPGSHAAADASRALAPGAARGGGAEAPQRGTARGLRASGGTAAVGGLRGPRAGQLQAVRLRVQVGCFEAAPAVPSATCARRARRGAARWPAGGRRARGSSERGGRARPRPWLRVRADAAPL
ncbi:unnamed protein product [Prorocentrum cordatum]|uniref:Uncharacterized protein n=1 Tax=Prorocentrum cordatum TaxID=2364126 RepID=A0ABN9QC24_9DINO|nr:unnamed protein product [Polarella glacialis]